MKEKLHTTTRSGLLLTLLLMMMTLAGTLPAMAALPEGYAFKVEKQDQFCVSDGGAIRVTVSSTTKSTAPNGSYHLVKDGTALNRDEAANDHWNAASKSGQYTWYNLQLGSYEVRFIGTGGAPGDLIGSATIESKVPTNYKITVTADASNVLSPKEDNPLHTGAILYEPKVTGVVGGPYTYKFTITHKDGSKETKTVEHQSGSYILEGLAQDDKVTGSVIDESYTCSTDNRNQVQLPDRTIGYTEANYVPFKSIFRVKKDGTCDFDNYVGFNLYIRNRSVLSLAKGLDYTRMKNYIETSGTFLISKNGGTQQALLAQTEIREVQDNGFRHTVTLKTPMTFELNDTWKVAYERTPGGSVWGSNFNFGGTIHPFGTDEETNLKTGTLVLENLSKVTDCKPEFTLGFYGTHFDVSGQDAKKSVTSYALPADAKIKIEKKNDAGQYVDVSDKVEEANLKPTCTYINSPAPSMTLGGGSSYTHHTLSLNAEGLGAGTYRISYSSDCEALQASKEIDIKVNGQSGVELKSATADYHYGFNGHTSGIVVEFDNTKVVPGKVSVTIDREENGQWMNGDYTFTGTPFLSDKEQSYTIHFPANKDDIPVGKFGSDTDKRYGIAIADLPKGTYRLTLADECGNVLTTDKVTITDDDLQAWHPKSADGYKDGIKRIVKCSVIDQVLMDFGEEKSVNNYYTAFADTKTGPVSGDFGFYESGSLSVGGKPWQLDPDARESVIHLGARLGYNFLQAYDAITKVCENVASNMFTIDPEHFCTKKFIFKQSGADVEALQVSTATYGKAATSKGMIAVDRKAGYGLTYPVHCELWDATATEADGKTTVTPTAKHEYATTSDGVNTYDANSEADVNHLFANLPQGWYTVKAYSNYQTDDNGQSVGCDPQIYNIHVTPVDIPNINADGVEVTDVVHKQYVASDPAKTQLDLPVSEQMYDVTWWDITDPANPVQLNDNKVGAAMDFTPYNGAQRYVIEARAMFATGPAKGTTGGARRVVLDYTDATPNYWMGGTAGKETSFYEPTNWTAGHVIKNGEDLVFATKANYGTSAKANCVLPEQDNSGKRFALRVADLKNELTAGETIRALIVSPQATLSVVGNIAGFDAADGKKLVVKADANGQKPSGSFLVMSNHPEQANVNATVEMTVWGHKLAASDDDTFTDNNADSPTKGKKLYGDGYAWQQVAFPVKSLAVTDLHIPASALQTYSEENNSATKFYQKWENIDPS